MTDIDYPDIELTIGEIEYNHTIKFEPIYYLQKFGANTADFDYFGTGQQCQILVNPAEDWSLGSILYQKYLVSYHLNDNEIGISGMDVDC